MRKIAVITALAALLAAAKLLPFPTADTTRLLPVRTLVLSREDGLLTLRADGGLSGTGTDPAQALARLENRAAGQVNPAQAEYVVLQRGTEDCLPELAQAAGLRLGSAVFLLDGDADPTALSDYLEAWCRRQPPCRLVTVLRGGWAEAPVLRTHEGAAEASY